MFFRRTKVHVDAYDYYRPNREHCKKFSLNHLRGIEPTPQQFWSSILSHGERCFWFRFLPEDLYKLHFLPRCQLGLNNRMFLLSIFWKFNLKRVVGLIRMLILIFEKNYGLELETLCRCLNMVCVIFEEFV